jgi:hypothetical protein
MKIIPEMFIQFGDRRINLSLVKEYKPASKSSLDKSYYLIKFTFLDGSHDEIHFFERKDERDEYLKKLDENLLF